MKVDLKIFEQFEIYNLFILNSVRAAKSGTLYLNPANQLSSGSNYLYVKSPAC